MIHIPWIFFWIIVVEHRTQYQLMTKRTRFILIELIEITEWSAIESDHQYSMFPAGIAYNHIMEEKALAANAKTLSGYRAIYEIVAHFIKHRGEGRIAINFADPIDLTAFVKGKTKMDIPELRDELGEIVKGEISRLYPVFPSALMSYSLMKEPRSSP